jgi:hypothetical protein
LLQWRSGPPQSGYARRAWYSCIRAVPRSGCHWIGSHQDNFVVDGDYEIIAGQTHAGSRYDRDRRMAAPASPAADPPLAALP